MRRVCCVTGERVRKRLLRRLWESGWTLSSLPTQEQNGQSLGLSHTRLPTAVQRLARDPASTALQLLTAPGEGQGNKGHRHGHASCQEPPSPRRHRKIVVRLHPMSLSTGDLPAPAPGLKQQARETGRSSVSPWKVQGLLQLSRGDSWGAGVGRWMFRELQ